jgi:N utilization substance protein A
VRGSRIRNIIDELNGEKVDILKWEEQPEVMIATALKPAQINSITLNWDERSADVLVDEDQLSLAIGRRGANVRLASRLAGWEINISGEAVPIEEEQPAEPEAPPAGDGPPEDATPPAVPAEEAAGEGDADVTSAAPTDAPDQAPLEDAPPPSSEGAAPIETPDPEEAHAAPPPTPPVEEEKAPPSV